MKNEILKNAGLLYEDAETAEDIYKKGLENPSKENFNKLLEIDKTGQYIAISGGDWSEFDYEKGLDALIKKGHEEHIYNAGESWPKVNLEKVVRALYTTQLGRRYLTSIFDWKETNPQNFDINKILNLSIELDKTGKVLYFLSIDVNKPYFYKKTLNALKQIGSSWYEEALKDFPKSATEKYKHLKNQNEVKIKSKRKKL